MGWPFTAIGQLNAYLAFFLQDCKEKSIFHQEIMLNWKLFQLNLVSHQIHTLIHAKGGLQCCSSILYNSPKTNSNDFKLLNVHVTHFQNLIYPSRQRPFSFGRTLKEGCDWSNAESGQVQWLQKRYHLYELRCRSVSTVSET